MKTRIITIIVIASVFTGIGFTLKEVKQDKKKDIEMVQRTRSEVPVEIVTAQSGNANFEITYNGTFEPDCRVTIVSESQGKIKDIIVEEGEFVQEGKIIATVENNVISYQLQTAETAYMKAFGDLKRYENLSPGEAITAQQLEEAKLAEINAKTTLQILKKQFDDTFIKAPVSGTISKRYIERGTFIAPGAPVADIVDTRKMKFNAWFRASDAIIVKTGQPVTIKTYLYPGIVYEGTIRIISVISDESKRYQVQALVNNSSSNPILPGTDGALTATLNSDKNSISIPVNCIVGSFIEPSVYVVDGDVAKLRQVIISDMNNDRVSISEGLNEGEQVVVSGQINLSDNTPVSIIKKSTL